MAEPPRVSRTIEFYVLPSLTSPAPRAHPATHRFLRSHRYFDPPLTLAVHVDVREDEPRGGAHPGSLGELRGTHKLSNKGVGDSIQITCCADLGCVRF
jgi:hypothetical protein